MDKLKLKALYADLRPDLDQVEMELSNCVSSDAPPLTEASLHLLEAGGKRIRPVFVLLSAKFGDFSIDRLKHVAVPVELIHMASLVHDDVIDDADTRRGRATVKAEWNNRMAMYTGDFLFSKAIASLSQIQSSYAHKLLADTMVELCIGEIEQVEDKRLYNLTSRDYLRRIRRKTALLISVSCELGALASGVDEKTRVHLRNFGYYVGMSFQIVDDILDIVSTDEKLGKPAGSDLLLGNITLPVVYARNEASVAKLLERIQSGDTSEETRHELLAILRKSDGLEKAKRISNLYLEKAMAELKNLPNCTAKRSLQNIALFMSKRKF
ncbi:polyprenyl synthetase family protein [Chryseomicrobium sp. FSL W7-1435]|uniref:polyprenyl synthetase family protein n=1 Tax=Chryseomicrobium sp. FSL W7-1435 TaxID=2921704 RepID=UPI003159AD7E